VGIAGDEVTTAATVKDVSERAGMTFYVFEATSENQRRETVCTGTWTIIVRGAS
jgi:acyl dehydratase